MTPAKKGGLVFGSAALLAFLALWEGRVYTVYADKLAGGLPTVCTGITRHVTDTPIVVGDKWSAAKCEAEERAALAKVQAQLIRCFALPPPQSVFDAATSHAWNLGAGATCGSAAMKAWNRGEWILGCRRIAFADNGRRVWSYVKTVTGYKFVEGLANRRDAEYQMCIEGFQ